MMRSTKISNEITKYTVELDGKQKLSCSDAFKIKADLQVDFLEIMKVCNSLGIKIMSCQLGCF